MGRRIRKSLVIGLAAVVGGAAVAGYGSLFDKPADTSGLASPSSANRYSPTTPQGGTFGGPGQVQAPAGGALPSHSAASGSGGGSTQTVNSVVPILKPQIVRTGTIDVRVARKGFSSMVDTASSDAEKLGGYVSSTTSGAEDSSSPYATLVLRVPTGSFLTLVSEIGGLGKIESKDIEGTDVTAQVVDISARLANLEVEETSLRQLMARTGSIPDILTVEDQLFSVEQQIEELSAQQSNLADQTSFGTLNVTLDVPPLAPAAKPKPKAPVNAAVRAAQIALHNTAAALHSFAIGVGELFPVLVLAVAGLLAFLAVRRRRHAPGAGAPVAGTQAV
ncbi:MAG TPA: DUF4349 domain-containing protein [Acidimicrobiales bacterium]|nr:DUF4349 domain-containing protein [Acidimicrobiales bacterium]